MGFGEPRHYEDHEWERHFLTGFVVGMDQEHKTIAINHDCPKDPQGDDVVSSKFNAFKPEMNLIQVKDLICFKIHIIEGLRYLHSVKILMRDGEFWKMVRGQKK